jgi:hypothetical protein
VISEWQREEVRNETRSRDVNESIEAATDILGAGSPTDTYVCECGDGACRDPISLSRPEYEAVRAQATWFAIAINHENPELDRVVEENERFTVVEKWLREAASIARGTDPRSGGGAEPAVRSPTAPSENPAGSSR